MTTEEIKARSELTRRYEEKLHQAAWTLRAMLDDLQEMENELPDCENEDTRLDRIIELVR